MSPFKGAHFAPALATLHALCFAAPWRLQEFEQILSLDTTFGFGDENGFILCADLGPDAEILTLAVHPEMRRKGLGLKLIETLRDWAKENNKEHLFLEVNATNTAAIALYQKAGFTQTGVRKNYYHENGQTFDALCFMWQKSPTE